MSFLGLLATRGRVLGLLLGASVLVLGGLYLRHSGYQKGYKQAELICEAEKAEQSQAVAERLVKIQERYQRELDELQTRNNVLSSRLDGIITQTRDEVNRLAEGIDDVQVDDDCHIGYDAVRLLDNLALDPTSPDDN